MSNKIKCFTDDLTFFTFTPVSWSKKSSLDASSFLSKQGIKVMWLILLGEMPSFDGIYFLTMLPISCCGDFTLKCNFKDRIHNKEIESEHFIYIYVNCFPDIFKELTCTFFRCSGWNRNKFSYKSSEWSRILDRWLLVFAPTLLTTWHRTQFLDLHHLLSSKMT